MLKIMTQNCERKNPKEIMHQICAFFSFGWMLFLFSQFVIYLMFIFNEILTFATMHPAEFNNFIEVQFGRSFFLICNQTFIYVFSIESIANTHAYSLLTQAHNRLIYSSLHRHSEANQHGIKITTFQMLCVHIYLASNLSNGEKKTQNSTKKKRE